MGVVPVKIKNRKRIDIDELAYIGILIASIALAIWIWTAPTLRQLGYAIGGAP